MKENLLEEQANSSCNSCRASNMTLILLIQNLFSPNLGMETCRQICPCLHLSEQSSEGWGSQNTDWESHMCSGVLWSGEKVLNGEIKARQSPLAAFPGLENSCRALWPPAALRAPPRMFCGLSTFLFHLHWIKCTDGWDSFLGWHFCGHSLHLQSRWWLPFPCSDLVSLPKVWAGWGILKSLCYRHSCCRLTAWDNERKEITVLPRAWSIGDQINFDGSCWCPTPVKMKLPALCCR